MSQKKPYNAGDETEVKKAASESEKFADAEYESLKFIMSDERGRRFVWWVLELCHLYELSFAGESHALTNLREGERNIGLQLIGRLHRQHLDDYIRMIREHEKEGGS